MKRLIMVAAAAVALAAYSGISQASDVVWVTKQVKWSTGADDSTGNGDWTFMEDEFDSTRTVAISTADWAFDAYGLGVITAAFDIATITFVAEASDLQSDSVYYRVEKGYNGQFARNNTITAAAGSVAILPGLGGNRTVFSGTLRADPDTQGNSDIWMVPEFRLCVTGDVSGTTPALAKLRCYITYPKRAQSQ